MIAVRGLSDSDPHAVYRLEVCQFIDDRQSPAEKLDFIHGILQRDMGEVRMFLERIEGTVRSAAARGSGRRPSFALSLAGDRAHDRVARYRICASRRMRIDPRFAPA